MTLKPTPEGLPFVLTEVIPNPSPVSDWSKSPTTTPMDLLSLAMSQGADLDRLERLMAMQESWDVREARKAFLGAMAAFKASNPTIIKNKQVDFETAKGRITYKHATLDEVADSISAAMGPVGLSFRWGVTQIPGRVQVTCYLQHVLGHVESVTLEGPNDDSGSKNAIQAMGSTITYLQRYSLLAVSGMAVKDQDNDGGGAGGAGGFIIEEGNQILEECRTVQGLQDEFSKLYRKAQETKNTAAMAAWIKTKDERKKTLQGGN